MARDRGSKSKDRDGKRESKRDGKGFLRRGRPKVCYFCKEKIAYVDYKDTGMLRRFVSDRGKIRARRVTGTLPASPARHRAGRQERARDGSARVHGEVTSWHA